MNMGTEMRIQKQMGLMPQTLDQAMNLSKMLASSEFVPKDFRGKPENILVAIQWGAEVGLCPMQAMQNIAVINGRPSLWGDAMLALVQSHPDYEYHKEWVKNDVAHCEVKRKGAPAHTATFSKAQATAAGLWGRNTWKSYPERMLQMRARGFALRDQFSDALKGLIIREEAEDYPVEETVPAINHGITITHEEKEEVSQIELMLGYIDAADSVDELKELNEEIKAMPEAERNAIETSYKNKLKALKGDK